MTEPRMIDELASVEHRQWSHWAKRLLEDETVVLSSERRARWQKLITTRYEDLSSSLREADMVWARKVKKIVDTYSAQ